MKLFAAAKKRCKAAMLSLIKVEWFHLFLSVQTLVALSLLLSLYYFSEEFKTDRIFILYIAGASVMLVMLQCVST